MEDNTSSGFLGEAPGILQWFNFLHNEEGFDRPRLMMISQELIAMKTRRVAEAPLYLRALSAVGAIISGFLLLYLLWLFGLFDLRQDQPHDQRAAVLCPFSLSLPVGLA
ncbi:hypothetical protein [uncultured Cohaesibacter sp.]|uniref:hypothetical protein n=1 Tax=uncultured Cohaesibacter sp. TaxID=1002546 RepID=UPI00292CC343|nr:hypothetical protein [uncultured Cohaesibacter sp.]